MAGDNGKAIIASVSSFQKSTHNYCKSKGIGHIRFFPETGIRWELMRPPSTNSLASLEKYEIKEAMFNEDYQSRTFDLYFSVSELFTNSLWDFIKSIFDVYADLLPPSLINIKNSIFQNVPIIGHSYLESLGQEILRDSGYLGGKVDLEDVYDAYNLSHGLIIKRGVEKPNDTRYKNALGRIIFDESEIQVFKTEDENLGRERFIIAHEISHFALNHSRYMRREICQESDFTRRIGSLEVSDISRMEYQANYLAGCLLMPKDVFLSSFWKRINYLQIVDRGFGALYVDEQSENLKNFRTVVGGLSKEYQVSFSVALIRLQRFKLINDQRRTSTGNTRFIFRDFRRNRF